jgi:hypothetical protein
MTGSKPKTSCKPLFQSLKIVTIPSEYNLSWTQFLLQHKETFTSNTEEHNFNTSNKLKLHKPINNLTLYQEGVYYMCIRIFNTRWFKYDWDKLWLVYTQSVPVIFEPPCKLPDYIANVVGNEKIFISTSSQYLVSKSFYTIEEFLND